MKLFVAITLCVLAIGYFAWLGNRTRNEYAAICARFGEVAGERVEVQNGHCMVLYKNVEPIPWENWHVGE